MRIRLWILPFLGLAFGYAYAWLYFNGALETWHLIGKPGEDIAQILGVVGDRNVLVATETGALYSFHFYTEGAPAKLPEIAWEEATLHTVDAASRPAWSKDYITLPPLFRVKQLYEYDYIYRVEGASKVKFALDDRGNLWMWKHQIAGLTGLVYFFYPLIGFVAGLAAALGVGLWRKVRRRS